VFVLTLFLDPTCWWYEALLDDGFIWGRKDYPNSDALAI